jgi:hypothetical protein
VNEWLTVDAIPAAKGAQGTTVLVRMDGMGSGIAAVAAIRLGNFETR